MSKYAVLNRALTAVVGSKPVLAFIGLLDKAIASDVKKESMSFKNLEQARECIKYSCVRRELGENADYYSFCFDRILNDGAAPEFKEGVAHANYNLGKNYNLKSLTQGSRDPELTQDLLKHLREMEKKGVDLMRPQSDIIKGNLDTLPIVYFSDLRNAYAEAHILSAVTNLSTKEKEEFFSNAKDKMDSSFELLAKTTEAAIAEPITPANQRRQLSVLRGIRNG